MIKGLILTLFLFGTVASFTQDQEKEVLELLNAVRTNPKKFADTHALPYIKENGLKKNRYAKSLLQDLKQTKAMGALQVAQALTDVARILTSTPLAVTMGLSTSCRLNTSGEPYSV